MNKVYVIGIGYNPLGETARRVIPRARLILASQRLFHIFKEHAEYDQARERIKVQNNVEDTICSIKTLFAAGQDQEVVLLASGDPLFFGIGRRVLQEFGKDQVEIFPDLSSIQMAFARIKEPWDDALLLSLHGGPDRLKRRQLPYGVSDLPLLIREHKKIAILTDQVNNPAFIAQALSSERDLTVYVCERLGYDDETVTSGSPAELAARSFSEPNIVIIKMTEPASEMPYFKFGLKERDILHTRGLITKDEIRAVVVHKLRLPSQGVLWDIGAGSGALAIEAARISPGLKVFAIERNHEQLDYIRKNTDLFKLPNLEVVAGEAPEALTGLPRPSRVFIGGSAGRMREIIALVAKQKAAVLVVSAATLETLNEAVAGLEEAEYQVEVIQVSVSRARNIGNRRGFQALNPVFVISGEGRS